MNTHFINICMRVLLVCMVLVGALGCGGSGSSSSNIGASSSGASNTVQAPQNPNDTQKPTVYFSAPISGSTVSGTIAVSATATDNVGVAGVQFQLDGQALGAEDTTAPYSIAWDTSVVAVGVHTLTAIARDAMFNTAISSITVTVADSSPPSVALTAPTTVSNTISGVITVSATASDNVGVAGVQFRLDGQPLGAEDASAPYSVSWDTSSAVGTHTLTAVARDAAGNSATSPAVTVTVVDTSRPNVTLSAPAPGSTVSGTILVSATASDNVGVVGVQFKLDGQALGNEDTTNPYSISWNTVYATAGSHILTAVARDAAGNSTTSNAISLTVSNPTSATVPAWRIGMQPWTWKAIGANTLADINPELNPLINPNYPSEAPWHGVGGWSSLMSKWSGGAWDEANKRLYVHGTGHTDGGDNSVVAINLNVDNPVWTLLRKPTGAIGNTGILDDGQEGTGKYFDGRPRATHTYGLLNIVDGDMFMWPMGAQYRSGAGNKRAWRFSASTNDWIDLGVPLTGWEEEYSGTVFVPPLRELWYLVRGNSPWWRYNVDTQAASKVGADLFSSSLKLPVYDPVRNLVVVFGNYPSGFKLINVTDFNRDLREPVIAGTVPTAYSSEGRGGDGWAYDPINDRFYSRTNTSGANLNVLLPPPNGDPFTGTWTWGVLQASPANTVTPTAPMANGTYGRFFVSGSLGVVGVINDTTQQIYVMAIEQGGTVTTTAPPPAPPAHSATPFSIGSQKFATAQDASDAAVDGDTIYIEPGVYSESVLLRANGLSFICPTGVAVFSSASVAYKWDKAIILIYGNDVVLSNIEIYGASLNDTGGAVVMNGSGLTINNSYFHDNAANGVLNGGVFPISDIVLNNSKIERCGEGSGLTHNIYVGRIRSLVLNNTISNDPNIGHNVKSRAARTVINGGTFIQGRGSRFLDTPVGGDVEVANATIYRDSTLGDNKDVLGFGLEVTTPEYASNTVNFRASNRIHDATNDMTILRVNPAWSPSVINIEAYTRF